MSTNQLLSELTYKQKKRNGINKGYERCDKERIISIVSALKDIQIRVEYLIPTSKGKPAAPVKFTHHIWDIDPIEHGEQGKHGPLNGNGFLFRPGMWHEHSDLRSYFGVTGQGRTSILGLDKQREKAIKLLAHLLIVSRMNNNQRMVRYLRPLLEKSGCASSAYAQEHPAAVLENFKNDMAAIAKTETCHGTLHHLKWRQTTTTRPRKPRAGSGPGRHQGLD